VPMPLHARARASLRPTLRAVAMGCINETIASCWLEASSGYFVARYDKDET